MGKELFDNIPSKVADLLNDVKNGRIGGDTGDGIFADPTGQFTRFDELAGKVVQPDLLAEGRNSGDA